MNAMLGKYGLWIFGGLIGGGAGYLFANRILNAAKEEAVQLELDFERAAKENGVLDGNQPGAGTKMAKDIVQAALDAERPDQYWDGTPKENGEDVVVTDEKTLNKKKKKPGHITDYAALSKRPLKDVAKEQLGSDETDDEVEEVKDANEPYVIDIEQYAARNGHDKVVLTYYDADDILCDESDTPVPSPDKLIGPDGLINLGQKSGDPDTVYIRNISLATDFEVVRLHKSYSVSVLGIEPEPPAKKRPASKLKPRTKKVTDEFGDDE